MSSSTSRNNNNNNNNNLNLLKEESNKKFINDKKKNKNSSRNNKSSTTYKKGSQNEEKDERERKQIAEIEYLNIQDEELFDEQQHTSIGMASTATLTKSISSNLPLDSSSSLSTKGGASPPAPPSTVGGVMMTDHNNVISNVLDSHDQDHHHHHSQLDHSSIASDNSAIVGGGNNFVRSESTTRLTSNDFNDNNSNNNNDNYDNNNNLANKLTKNLIFAVLASTVGSSFQHGYNIGVINAPEKLIAQFINNTYIIDNNSSINNNNNVVVSEAKIDFILSIIVSIYCIGGCIGALLTAFVADRIGRKEGLFYNNILVLLACPMMASSKTLNSYKILILGRLIIGINAGLNAGLAPLYLNEISPVNLRGALGTIYQLIITISIFLSNIFGLPNFFGTSELWPFLFVIPLLPAALMLITLPHCFESPKHLLLNKGHQLQAQQALAWFRGTGDIQEEMDDLINENEKQKLLPPITINDLYSKYNLRKPMIISIVIMLSQQFSGINAVLFFSTSIFRDAGLGQESALKATLGMSLANVLMTIVSLFLVDRCGRKTLHMTGLMGMAVTSIILALCLGSSPTTTPNQDSSSFIAVISVYIFIIMFASGPGSIPWFLVSELFPSNARPLASSVAVSVNWLANFTVSLCFLPISNVLHGFTFFIFAALLVYFFLFTYYKVPETKGVTADEISALFINN